MTSAAAEVRHHEATRGLARAGLLGHGIIYLLIGVLAVFLAAGKSKGETDQTGALQELDQHTGGTVLLVLIAIGLSAYALWHLIQVFTGPMHGASDGKEQAKERVASAARAILYAATAVSAWEVVARGRTQGQAGKQETWTARAMQHSGGRWLVGLVGLVIIGIGGYLVYRSFKREFTKELDLSSASARTRRTVLFLGKWGGAARGTVVIGVGILFLVAAIQYDPQKARGVDGALRSLRDTAIGPWLLGVVAIGLVLFGAYGIAESRFRRLDR